ncbi:MAG: S1 RNA-binding domain-containing protein [Lachnospiraceae bacterium]
MLKLGERQQLEIIKKVDFGVYLMDPQERNSDERVLLPMKQLPREKTIGDLIEVFLYRDSKDRMIATTTHPLIELNQVKALKVIEVAKIGAFLDWGLEKDLLLPFGEQTKKVKAGDECLVTLYIDKSSRLCATMKVYHQLKSDSPYRKNDRVEGIVYEISKNFGAFVAVDDCYSALIPRKEFFGELEPGDRIQARVTAVKEDGKLDLSIREKLPVQIALDAEKVIQIIREFDGALPFNDKANPEVIRREMGMSKNEFKRAVGHLLKEKKIEITEKSIRLV